MNNIIKLNKETIKVAQAMAQIVLPVSKGGHQKIPNHRVQTRTRFYAFINALEYGHIKPNQCLALPEDYVSLKGTLVYLLKFRKDGGTDVFHRNLVYYLFKHLMSVSEQIKIYPTPSKQSLPSEPDEPVAEEKTFNRTLAKRYFIFRLEEDNIGECLRGSPVHTFWATSLEAAWKHILQTHRLDLECATYTLCEVDFHKRFKVAKATTEQPDPEKGALFTIAGTEGGRQ